MKERFLRFVETDLSRIPPNRMQQVSEVLLETRTVRIILTRYAYRKEDLDIDIEVSLLSLPATSDISRMQSSIESQIAILQYLKRLTFMGFSLEILQEEGILIASTVLNRDTKEEVFMALEPPDLHLIHSKNESD